MDPTDAPPSQPADREAGRPDEPSRFLWGVATSAYQAEGGYNQEQYDIVLL